MWPWFAQTRCQEYLGDNWGILNMESALDEHLLTWKMEIISLKKQFLLNLLKKIHNVYKHIEKDPKE